MSLNDIKHLAVETIYLVPDSSEGQRCYLWCDDPAPGLDMDPSESVEYLRKDVHDAIIAKQANAAKSGMDAAKKVAGSNLEQAKRLHAECNPQALESERESNARLTEQIAKLEAHIAALKDDIEIHRVAEETQIALRQKMEKERDALAASLEALREKANLAVIAYLGIVGDSCWNSNDRIAFKELGKVLAHTSATSSSTASALISPN